jgi:Pvc16 N-terminal domain
MATSTIIRSVTEALLRILRADLGPILSPTNIVAAPPETVDKATTTQTLILYLYQVLESPYLKNSGAQVMVQAPLPPPVPPAPKLAQTAIIERDPLALDLYYLLIPFSSEDNFLDTYDILGAAMSSFHDHGIFSPAAVGVHVPPPEVNLEFRLSLNPLSTSDLLRLWEAVHRPYRLSVAYVVRTVRIDSRISTIEPLMSERKFEARSR